MLARMAAVPMMAGRTAIAETPLACARLPWAPQSRLLPHKLRAATLHAGRSAIVPRVAGKAFALAGAVRAQAGAGLRRGKLAFQAAAGRGISSLRRLPNPNSIVYILMGTNLAVYGMWQVYDRRWMMRHFTLSADGLRRRGRWWTLITHYFSHFNVWHLAANMVGLYVFGPLVAGAMGSSFLGFYTVAGIGSGLGDLAWEALQKAYFSPSDWMASSNVMLGASGAVYGVVSYGIAMNPAARLYLYGILPMPAWLLGVGLVGFSVYGMLQNAEGDNVGHSAHLTGALIGLATFAATRARIRRFR